MAVVRERYRIIQTTNRFFTIERLIAGTWHVLPPLRGSYFLPMPTMLRRGLRIGYTDKKHTACISDKQHIFDYLETNCRRQ